MNSLELFIGFLVQQEPWKERAACRTVPLDNFFPRRGQSQAPAKRACASCPVSQECREYARRTGTEYGIWAGRMINGKAARHEAALQV